MTHAEGTLIIVLAALVVLALVAVATVAVRSGWVVFTASLRVIPPWQRKAPEKPVPKVAVAPEPAANGAVPIGEARKAGAA